MVEKFFFELYVECVVDWVVGIIGCLMFVQYSMSFFCRKLFSLGC